MTYDEGAQVYIVENNSHVTPVQIVRKTGDFYVVGFPGKGGAAMLRQNRLFPNRDSAEKVLARFRGGIADKAEVKEVNPPGYRSPYDYANVYGPYGI